MKKKKKKLNKYDAKNRKIRIITTSVLVVLALTFVIFTVYSKGIFGYDWLANDETPTAEMISEWFSSNFPILLKTLLLIVVILLIIFVLQMVRKMIGTKSKKVATFVSILFSILKWGLVIFAIMRTLWYWGVDVMTILTGLGIVALVVGLGCQSLISDVVAGIFLVIDSAFEVGDVVVVDGFRGVVKEIGLKATKIEDVGGNIKLVQNSSIDTVINLTHVSSVAINDVCIGYNEDVRKVEELIEKNIDKITDGIKGILEKPQYQGVDALTDSSINMRYLTRCKEEDRFRIERMLNRNFLIFLQENKITIPFKQITINDSDFKKSNK